MNQLSIQMAQEARRAGRRKGRKRALRRMKKLVGVLREHARRHRELLDQRWEETEWTRAQVDQILRRIDRVLELLPEAQKQAHERIIGGRPVANADKNERFVRPQRRRAQTEGRVGILKHGFLGGPIRAKGFAHRELTLAWGVLTQNLWVLARMRKVKPVARPRPPQCPRRRRAPQLPTETEDRGGGVSTNRAKAVFVAATTGFGGRVVAGSGFGSRSEHFFR